MTLTHDEFMRRFLLHVPPSGFHRIRHYGLVANTGREDNLVKARELLMHETINEDGDTIVGSDEPENQGGLVEPDSTTYVCPDCGAPIVIIETFMGGQLPRAPPMHLTQQ